MKDNLNRLAKGNFRYEPPTIFISEEKIEVSIQEEGYRGFFRIQGSKDSKGIIYSTDFRVRVENNIFWGPENNIRYYLNTKGLLHGDSIEGQFNIVSNAGEFSVPYRFVVIFTQPRVSLETEEQDEPITLYLDEYNKIYGQLTNNFKDTIVIHKSGCGYIPMQIYTDCEFIKFTNYSENHCDSDSFIGKRFALEYILDLKSMHSGRNYGCITIKTDTQEISCRIEARKQNIPNAENSEERLIVRNRCFLLYEFYRNYISFRIKKITIQEWIAGCQNILDKRLDKNDVYYKVMQVMLLVFENKTEESKKALEYIQKIIENNREDTLFYCFYLYISSLVKNDSVYSNQIFQRIKLFYEEEHSWQLLWMLFYTGEVYNRNPSIKLVKIKEQFHSGCNSPILYLEAVKIFNSNPVLLRVLNRFEIQVIFFAGRNNLVQEDFAKQIFYVSKNDKNISSLFIKILYKIYKLYQDDEMLTVLCGLLIRNGIFGENVLDIYELGIKKNLKITKLYEYYMQSVDESKREVFPQMVLLYFAYNNQLSMEKKAYLYANIIFNKEKDISSYNSYRKQIEIFAYEQMKKGNINDNLAVIYKELFDKSLINSEDCEKFYKFYFTYKITVDNKNVRSIMVRHKELVAGEKIILERGTAYLQIYTDNPILLFENEKGNLIHTEYTLTRLFTFREDLAEAICECSDSENIFMFLHKSECILNREKKTPQDYSIQRYLLRSPEVAEEYKKMLRKWIISYFYDNEKIVQFKENFSDIEIENLSSEEAFKLTELCIQNKMSEEAYNIISLYGWQEIRIEMLHKFCIEMLHDLSYNRIIAGISWKLFEEKIFDAEILRYLARYFNGTSNQMYQLCQRCREEGVDCHELQERVVSQLLFTRQNQKQLDHIFEEYYNYGAGELFVKAYLCYNSYQYFVKEDEISELAFQIIKSTLMEGETTETVNILALLKYYSKLKNLSEENKGLSEKLIEKLCNEERVFAFYHQFATKITLPFYLYDKTVIEYRTNPRYQVALNYRILNEENSSDEYHKEILKDTFMGIHTKAFVLLYGDILEYYFTVTSEEREASTIKMRLVYDKINTSAARKRFDYMNDILAGRALEDSETMQRIMHDYCVQDYFVTQLFQTLV